MNIIGEVIHGKGKEAKTGFPTANITTDVDLKLGLYICDSDYGVALVWKRVDVEGQIMAYFINLPHNEKIYGKILLINVNPINFQRRSEFIYYICKTYCDCSN